jgi:hypothetical protein
MSSDQPLSGLVDGKKVLAIEATPVPAPLGVEHPGNHLFVNCLYRADIIELRPEALLAHGRADTIRIIRKLVTSTLLDDAVSICISFMVRREAAEYSIRVYRYSILTSELSRDANSIGASLIQSKKAIESSHHDGIVGLLCAEGRSA